MDDQLVILTKMARTLHEMSENLPDFFSRWDSFDDDSKYHYANDIEWGLCSVQENMEGIDIPSDLFSQIKDAVKNLHRLDPIMQEKLGFVTSTYLNIEKYQ
jgi:hypothetical protein